MSHTDKEDRNILHTIKRRKSNCIGHILRRNSLLNLLEGNTEVTGRRRRRRRRRRSKQLLDVLKEQEIYWNLRGSTGSHSLEYSLCKKLRTSRKIYYVVAVVVVVMMEVMHARI